VDRSHFITVIFSAKAASDKGIAVKNILETPIAGLTLYHQSCVTRATASYNAKKRWHESQKYQTFDHQITRN